MSEVGFEAYLSAYPLGFADIIFWLDLSHYQLCLEEMIELVAISRGTSEKIDPTRDHVIEHAWLHNQGELSSLNDVCQVLQKKFQQGFLHPTHLTIPFVGFVHPIIYIKEVTGCKTAQEILERYSREISGLSNLWIYDTYWQKERHVKETVKNDVHPFEYGVTCISTACTAELHPSMTVSIAEKERQPLDAHHIQELCFLFFLCEVPLSQFFILRAFDTSISRLLGPGVNILSMWNPLGVVSLVRRASQLTEFQRRLTYFLSQFKYTQTARKSYLQQAVDLFRAAFSVPQLEEAIDNKIMLINAHIGTLYSMLTTIFVLILSIAAVVLALIQVLSALKVSV